MAKTPSGLQSRWIVGKQVAAVITSKIDNREHNGTIDTALEGIVFTDGSRIGFIAHESDFEPYVKAIYLPAQEPRTC